MTLLLGLGTAAFTAWHDISRYHHLTTVGSLVIVIAGMITVAGLVRFPW